MQCIHRVTAYWDHALHYAPLPVIASGKLAMKFKAEYSAEEEEEDGGVDAASSDRWRVDNPFTDMRMLPCGNST